MTELAAETEQNDPHEYVELMLDIEDGQVIGCEFYGEGRQAEPLTEPAFFMPVAGVVWPRGMARIARRVKLALGRLSRS
jgi:hypothetical protein